MTKEMKINKCGCGGEVSVKTTRYFQLLVQCSKCKVGITEMHSETLSIEKVVERWNTAHPEISNAMQAVKWLEEGNRIHNEKLPYYLELSEKKVVAYSKETQDRLFITVSIDPLFNVECWKTYDEPTFILGTFKEAREHLKAGKRASIIYSQEKIEFELVRQKYGNYILHNKEKQYEFQLQDVDYDSCAWRLYND